MTIPQGNVMVSGGVVRWVNSPIDHIECENNARFEFPLSDGLHFMRDAKQIKLQAHKRPKI